MSDPKYSYATQNNFTGGICTEAELRKVSKAGEVTVAEAADVWAPNGVLKRRPGVSGIAPGTQAGISLGAGGDELIGEAFFLADDSTTPIYATAGAGDDVEVIVGLDATGLMYIPCLSGTAYTRWNTIAPVAYYWVPPDGSIWNGSAICGQSVDTPGLVDSVTVGTLWGVYTAVTTGPDTTLYLYQVSSGSQVLYNTGGASPLLGGSDVLLGAHFAPLPSGDKYLGFSTDFTFPTYLRLHTTPSISTVDTSYRCADAYDPALYTPLSVASWATVVDANRVYVAYANQVYEYRPELASPFRLAQVNSDPAIVGPGATYDPTIFGQYNVFPRAGQIVYFNGLLFFTAIKGNPNIVQWGGPAYDGAVDILPVLSYAILADSRDNSPNVGFGVFNSNLYVFKQNSIWVLVPAGQSEVDGSYLFTSRLVTSGAGCSAPGSIVSTPQGIIFYNAGGFYIFNGQKTHKLTDQVKQLFDAISPSNAYQMQAAHWATQHSYVVSCQISHPWASDVFEDLPSVFTAMLCYDYQNNAWWLWLSVSDKLLYVDRFNNLVTQQFVNQFRVLDPNKEYDSDALAKSTAQPYIKTQRFGYGESLQKKYRELRVTGEIDNLDIDTSIEINDQLLAATDYAMTFIPVDYAEIPLGDTIYDGSPYSPPWGRTEVPIEVTNDGQWAQVRLNGNYGPFTVYNINLGYYVEGRNG